MDWKEFIKAERAKTGLSQEKFARMLGEEMNTSLISRWERGLFVPYLIEITGIGISRKVENYLARCEKKA